MIRLKSYHKKMVHREGLEPTTFCSEDRRSNPLSYRCTRYLYYTIFHRSLHQSWGIVMLAAGIIIGTILGIIFRINYFASPIWLAFVVTIFMFMYFKPKFLIIGFCLIAGMVLAFFRVAVTITTPPETEQTKSGTETLVLDARDWFAERVKTTLPEKEANLGISYLLGQKTNLDKALTDNLRMVGLTHIVVASGAHLSILVELARKIFGKISRFSGLLFSILFILFFMCMVGWTPSILRAGIMAILTLVSWYVGRKIAPWRMILIVAAFTLILDPTFLTNLGWLLSFASYAGIMLLGPKLTKFFYGSKKPKFIASVILTTIAATLITLPITLYYFGQVSIISIIANLLILPTLPYAMGLTFLAGLFTGIPGLEIAAGFLATKLLDFHIGVVEFFGSLEQFLIKINPYDPRVFLLYLIILTPFIFGFFKKLCYNKTNA